MEIVENTVKTRKATPLTCAEIGCLMGSYSFGEKELSLTNDVIYLGALMLFDLYEHELIDLIFYIKGKAISIKYTDKESFDYFDDESSFDVARSLVIATLVDQVPKSLPQVHQQLYTELLRMAYMFGPPSPISCHDFFVCCKTQLLLNMQMMECRAWLVLELERKKILYYKKRLFILMSYYLNDYGREYCTYLAERLNEMVQCQYMRTKSDFTKFDNEKNQRNCYIVSQLIIHLGTRALRDCSNISADTVNRAKQRQKCICGQIGGMLRQPMLKLQPDNQEAWLVCMCAAVGQCIREAGMSIMGLV